MEPLGFRKHFTKCDFLRRAAAAAVGLALAFGWALADRAWAAPIQNAPRSKTTMLLPRVKARAEINLPPDLSPSWKRVSMSSDWEANCSFLSDMKTLPQAPLLDLTILQLSPDEIMDPEKLRRYQNQYDQMLRSYEYRKHHSLTSPDEDRWEMRRRGDFSQGILDEMGKYQGEKSMRALKKAGMRNPDVRVLARPISFLTASFFVFTREKPLEVRISETSSVSLRFARMLASSPEKDLYHVSYTQKIPFWGLATGVSYGGSSNIVSASIQKPLTEHLIWSLGTRRPLTPASSPLKVAEDSTQLVYRIGF